MMGPHDVKNMFQTLLDAAEQRRLADVNQLLGQLQAAEERVRDERTANRVLSKAVTLLVGTAESALTVMDNLYAMNDPTETDVREHLSQTIDDLRDEMKKARTILGIEVNYGDPNP